MRNQPVDLRGIRCRPRRSASSATSASTLTANLNTACPSMRRNGSPVTLAAADVARARQECRAWLPSACRAVARMPGSSAASSTTAPAPSPNSTQVPRSFQSRMRENTSAPTTSAHRCAPERMNLSAMAAHRRSRCTPPARRRRRAVRDAELVPAAGTAVLGKTKSGVEVATMIRSTSSGRAARPLPAPDGWPPAPDRWQSRLVAAMWRSRMPVRSTIQSSDVSTHGLHQVVVGDGMRRAESCRCR